MAGLTYRSDVHYVSHDARIRRRDGAAFPGDLVNGPPDGLPTTVDGQIGRAVIVPGVIPEVTSVVRRIAVVVVPLCGGELPLLNKSQATVICLISNTIYAFA